MIRKYEIIILLLLCVASEMRALSLDMGSCPQPAINATEAMRIADPWAGYPKYVTATSGDLNPFGATDQTGVTCSPLSIMTSDLARPDEVIEELPFVADGHLSLILRTNSKQSGGYRYAAIFKAPPSTEEKEDPINPDIIYGSPLGDAEGFLCLMALLLLMIKRRKRAKVGETEHLSDDTTILKTL